MIDKHREPLRRPRPRSRLSRREAAVPAERVGLLAAARQTACRYVAAHWPELACVRPTVSTRRRHVPAPELLARLGLDPESIVLRTPELEYTFTFASEELTPEGYAHPLVAAVTVDEQQHVVKTMVSR